MAKVLVSLDDALLRRIDRAARARGFSRSAYIAELVSRDLSRELGPGKAASTRRALAEVDRLLAATPAGDSTQLVRAERDAR